MVQQADLLQGDAAASDKRKEKSPNALRTISEAADVLGVPQHVLRFWETKFPQITPLKRNGGRRFYRPEDIVVLQQVKFLLYQQGYTIKGARKAIEDFAKGELPTQNAAESTEAAPPKAWYQSVPAANSNDNAHAEPAAPSTSTESPKEHVDAMRNELVQMRESLKKLLPNG